MTDHEEKGIDHLIELRKRFIRVLLFFVIILIGAFTFVPEILDFIKLTASAVDVDLNVFNITDPLLLHLKVASLVAFIASFPYLIIELWLFIRPGLTKNERRFVYKYIPMIFILFTLGIGFAYFVLVPYYIMFSQQLAGNTDLNIVMGANKYIDFLSKMLLYFGLIFQFPVLVFILSYIGIVSSGLLTVIRKYAYFALLITSAFITPPDPVSMGIALVPLAFLYEISILLCKLNERKRRKKLKTS
ncbi:twin-arginine translocase subunit TatC [Anaeromicrobium sediminis]|uniref:Sec-independent protein translocase protein TatC n=1 Tax=Anaeromicrobium sediminis TaxID=1478221 RepID=A0A267MFP8_9FIRM|nr:twin-arginine translocase subunit TatC [Anaeromicrobium sediminis]PAB58399.1 twin-arginine translocase subunit TatC [Anaeromicrobium sediminis]